MSSGVKAAPSRSRPHSPTRILPQHLYAAPNALAQHYSKFRVAERLLLTGHSHQAWPDRGFEGQCRAWLDAAEYADEKWDRAFAQADRVRRGFAQLLDDTDGWIALAASTHALIIRFLSGLPLRDRPRIVTTDGEFHTIRRQLDRLAEEGIEIVKVSVLPAATLAERLILAVDDRTATVMVSSILFQSGIIVQGLGEVLEQCEKVGAKLLVDAYHSLNSDPFSLRRERLERAYVVGGGYKYCQLGEGNCFLRFPRDCELRPVITGWYSEFELLAEEADASRRVEYGRGPSRFAGATYDPTSHYRAVAVFEFFEDHGLTPDLLRQVSQHQVGLLARLFDALDADPQVVTRDRSVPLEDTGGFLALSSHRAGELSRELRELGVFTDFRGNTFRLGPAPYLSDLQLRDAIGILGTIVLPR